jgi:hypothetical protein
MKILSALICLTLTYSLCFAQITIRGNVKDEITGKPIENVSIYFNNTQIGTKTNEEGNFMIYAAVSYKELVLSAVGYEKIVMNGPTANAIFKFTLKPKTNLLKEVFIGNKLSWNKWGDLFFKLLMGDDLHAYYNSKILNPEVIILHYDKNESTLTATSTEPIIIDHLRLGYKIKLDLEELKYNFLNERLSNISTAYFEENLNKKSNLQSVQLSTNYSYYGSQLHFYRSLVNHTLNDEGYKIYKYSSIKNAEKKRVEDCINKLKLEKLKEHKIKLRFDLEELINNRDTLQYYRSIINKPSVISEKLEEINEKSILHFNEQEKLFQLVLKDTVLIKYTSYREKYLIHTSGIYTPEQYTAPFVLESFISLINDEPFFINNNGQTFSNNLLVTGKMAYTRLAKTLPANFNPKVPRTVTNHGSLKSP